MARSEFTIYNNPPTAFYDRDRTLAAVAATALWNNLPTGVEVLDAWCEVTSAAVSGNATLRYTDAGGSTTILAIADLSSATLTRMSSQPAAMDAESDIEIDIVAISGSVDISTFVLCIRPDMNP